jgi:hypothetical protein
MQVTIEHAAPLIAADLNVAGAAVKVLIAGGSALNEQQARKASGASAYLWREKGGAIMSLVSEIEATADA